MPLSNKLRRDDCHHVEARKSPERDSVMVLVRVARAMQVEETEIPAVKILIRKKHGDARGFYSESYNKARMGKVWIRPRVRSRQPFVVGCGWNSAGIALSDAAVRPG
jgi:hypothetical protein